MKKISLFFVILVLLGCENNPLKQTKSISVNCPLIFFAKEHKTYIGSASDDINLDNISYISQINNAKFNKKCLVKNDIFFGQISILFVVTPLIKSEENIQLNYYIASLDKDKNLKDMQYYSSSGIFYKNPETDKLSETEIIVKENITFSYSDNVSNIVIGYMLDEKKLKLLY